MIDPTTEIEGRNEYTNLVRKVTTLDVLAEVRRAFRTLLAGTAAKPVKL